MNTSVFPAASALRLNETHDPRLSSFVETANDPNSDFPIQNLPLAVFRRQNSAQALRVGVGIGDQILDIAAVQSVLEGAAREAAKVCEAPSMNALMDLGPAAWSALRLGLSRALRSDSPQQAAVQAALTPLSAVEFALPVKIGNFSDYAASLHHVAKVTRIVRPENPAVDSSLLWSPIAYHHRASTVRTDGHGFRRPKGLLGHFQDGVPVVGPSAKLDYEAELGIYISRTTGFGEPLAIDEAEDCIFGLTVLNDWTARDMMFWERLPLGPFLSKSFDTTVSPWIVTMEALAPFRDVFRRSPDLPAPLPGMDTEQNRQRGGLDVHVEVLLQTQQAATRGDAPVSLSRTNTRDMHWTLAQILAHQTSAGCNLEQGDLIGTGTISGPEPEASGCMFELTQGGAQAVELPSGERRGFVEDGDTVTVRAYCEAAGYRRIGFGNASSTVLPNP